MEREHKHSDRLRHESARKHPNPEVRGPISALHQDMFQMQRSAGNRVTMQMLSNRTDMPVMQREYKFKGKKYSRETYSDEDLDGVEGTNGSITNVQADRKMPTFYGVLSKIFQSSNLNSNAFQSSMLGSSCDRPHSVSANLIIGNKEYRANNAEVTQIGHLGTDEMKIREGYSSSRNIIYNGGHLVGHQVLGGKEADHHWNVAPQDEDNNKFAYNNTIERMIRGAEPGTEINYNVNVSYRSLNFKVNQHQLKQHGIINHYEKDKPWELQLPSRIPQHWEAEARIVNPGKGDSSFGMPKNGSTAKTNLQSSQELISPLSHIDKTHTARFKLSAFNQSEEVPRDQLTKANVKNVESVKYRMHQEQPVDLDQVAPPSDWDQELLATEFGSVEPDQVTADKVRSLIDEIDKEFGAIEQMDDISAEEFDVSESLKDKINFLLNDNTPSKPLESSKKSVQKRPPHDENLDQALKLVVEANYWKKDDIKKTIKRYRRTSADLENRKKSMQQQKRRLNEMKQLLSQDDQVVTFHSELQEMRRRKDDLLAMSRVKNQLAEVINDKKRTYEAAFGQYNSNPEGKRRRNDDKGPIPKDIRRDVTQIFGRNPKLNKKVIMSKIKSAYSNKLPFYKKRMSDSSGD